MEVLEIPAIHKRETKIMKRRTENTKEGILYAQVSFFLLFYFGGGFFVCLFCFLFLQCEIHILTCKVN